VTDDSRTLMVRAAARLFQERGYAATSFQDVIARSGAPRGSIYHHFPGGKEQLAAEALQWYAGRMRDKLAEKRASSSVEAIEGFLRASREAMKRSGFRAGCPVAAVALDLAPGDERLHAVVQSALQDWHLVLVRSLERDGLAEPQAHQLASFVIATVEGALLLARIERSVRPIDDITTELMAYVRQRIG
jgi:TetR/AcrR family transcriptional regulator, lmrAB and yxaGH operons repressor